MVCIQYNATQLGFSGGSVVKNLPVNAGNTGGVGSIPGSESSSGGGTPVFLLG